MADISFVVAVQDNLETLKLLLRSFRELESKEEIEMVFIDNFSQDVSAEYACVISRLDRRIRVFRRQKRFPLPQNRNLGAGLSKGDIIVYADSDVFFEDKNSPRIIAEVFRLSDANIVCPAVADVHDNDIQSVGLKGSFYLMLFAQYFVEKTIDALHARFSK